TFSTRTVWKPESSTSTTYDPGASPRRTYWPFSLETVLAMVPVASAVARTVAPGTTPPSESRTTPVTPQVVVCAGAPGAVTHSARSTANTVRSCCLVLMMPSFAHREKLPWAGREGRPDHGAGTGPPRREPGESPQIDSESGYLSTKMRRY